MVESIFATIEEVRREFAPDPRTAVFEIDLVRERGELVVCGAISIPAAAEELERRLATLPTSVRLRNQVVRIPDTGVDRLAHGIVTAALAPVLSGPLISETHLSQIPLGHRVLILREHGRWLQCRAPDGYIGWIHRGYVRRTDETGARAWELGADAPAHLSLGADIRDDRGRTLVRLPWGARFGLREGSAILPDGSTGILEGDAVSIFELRDKFPTSGAAVAATATRWLGVPYLWGGTTTWGADCSGFVQAVFRLHGIELPRDSDQQAAIGEILDTSGLGYRDGDLLFFAERSDRISHVAISMGDTRIIHSSVGNGGVRENDLGGESGYERELTSLLVAARRVIAPEAGSTGRSEAAGAEPRG